MPELPVAERIKSFVEADLVISEEDAKRESARCLSLLPAVLQQRPGCGVGQTAGIRSRKSEPCEL